MKWIAAIAVSTISAGCAAPADNRTPEQIQVEASKRAALVDKMKSLRPKIEAGQASADEVKTYDKLACDYQIAPGRFRAANEPNRCLLNTLVLPAGKEAAFITAAREALVRDFKDPASAQFRETKVTRDSEGIPFWCGEVNGKNSYGAYTGFKRFFATDTPSEKAIDNGAPAFSSAYSRRCN